MTRQELAAFVYESQAVLAEIEQGLQDDSTPLGELYLSYADMGKAGEEVLERITRARLDLNRVGRLLGEFGIGESHLNAGGEPCFGSRATNYPDAKGACQKCNRVLDGPSSKGEQ